MSLDREKGGAACTIFGNRDVPGCRAALKFLRIGRHSERSEESAGNYNFQLLIGSEARNLPDWTIIFSGFFLK